MLEDISRCTDETFIDQKGLLDDSLPQPTSVVAYFLRTSRKPRKDVRLNTMVWGRQRLKVVLGRHQQVYHQDLLDSHPIAAIMLG